MRCELLERRQLLASVLSGGVLTITGTIARDNIDVFLSGESIAVIPPGRRVPDLFPRAQINQIVIDAVGGNDIVKVSDAITVPANINGGSGNDSIKGGGGD